MTLTFSTASGPTIPIWLISKNDQPDWPEQLDSAAISWAGQTGFGAGEGETCVVPDHDGHIAAVLAGMGTAATARRSRFVFGAARTKLPQGNYHIANPPSDGDACNEAALAWLLAGYRFNRYAGSSTDMAQLRAPEGCDAATLEHIAAGEALTRDLINTPSNDMGPAELEAAARDLAQGFGAAVSVTMGASLLDSNFPMIHSVGRASSRAPRLIDLSWGDKGPHLTLVGKGVCFDTGGLNIKPGASMGLMKKDMGGAANVLGLARMIMGLGLKLRLRVLIPAVENAISGDAFRPGDILPSRKGLSVEINNTDAEGRLVLADALALADESETDLIISMATLTGAARVAVGPDLAPFYATQPDDADHVRRGAVQARDPVWEMPFWDPYEAMIEPGIADLDNAPKGGFAGSITAALFLRRFVTNCPRYMHFDIYGWNPTAAPARPKGGAGQGARALLTALPELLKG